MPDLNRILSKVGFHSVYEKNVTEAIDLASRYGFSSVQIEAAMPQFFQKDTTVLLEKR